MSYAIWGMLTMAGTYHFGMPYVRPEDDDRSRSVMITLDTSSSSEEAAGAEAAAVLQRMGIEWLCPVASGRGPWRLNRRKFAEYFELSNREWLVGDQVLRPVFDRQEKAGQQRLLLRFVLSPDGPLAWSWGAAPENPWSKVEHQRARLLGAIDTASTSDEFQHVGLLSRDLAIACAQAVYDRAHHLPTTDKVPGRDDAKRMLADFAAVALRGEHKALADLVNAVWNVAVHLQHKRSATYVEAMLCATAAVALTDMIRVLPRPG